jgi:hypothetical protein
MLDFGTERSGNGGGDFFRSLDLDASYRYVLKSRAKTLLDVFDFVINRRGNGDFTCKRKILAFKL